VTHNDWTAKVKKMIKQESEKELKEQILKSKELEDSIYQRRSLEENSI
jgi:hypothetical protein